MHINSPMYGHMKASGIRIFIIMHFTYCIIHKDILQWLLFLCNDKILVNIDKDVKRK